MFRKRFWFALAVLFLGTSVYGQGKDAKVTGEYSLDVRDHVYSIAISPNGKTLAVGADNIHLFDLTGEEPKATKVIPSRYSFGAKTVAFSPDSKFLASGGGNHKVTIWSLTETEPKKVSESNAHAGTVWALAFAKDGKSLLSGSDDKSMILWNFNDGKITESTVIRSDDKTSAPVRAVAFPLPNITKVVSYNTDGYLRFWTANKAGKFAPNQTDKLPRSGDPNLVFRHDAKALAVSEGNAIELVALPSGGKATYANHTKRVSGLAFSPDGILLASCGIDGRINIWVVGGKTPHIQKERPDTLTCIAFTPPPPEGTHTVTHLAAGSDRGKVYVIKVEPGEPKKK